MHQLDRKRHNHVLKTEDKDAADVSAAGDKSGEKDLRPSPVSFHYS